VKTAGTNVGCPWWKVLTLPLAVNHSQAILRRASASLQVVQTDPALGIEQIRTETRPFWIKSAGTEMDGQHLLAFVIAEQQWISESSADYNVRPGDVVVDVGAHIGSFGDDALRKGASKVIMVEPDPVNVECIRRNFREEIASGKVILVPEGAWSKADTLTFKIGVSNSGTGTFVLADPGHTQEMQVPVRPLDDMLRNIGVSKVDFIKMDIEGAEREALKGAGSTLAHSKPRLMMDMYHLPDDAVVLPQVIMSLNSSYKMACTACSRDKQEGGYRVKPYATFFY
jgi:FkbM family methyltransferase